jgi:DNA-binding LacI/PurR family transcriptional regulator
MGKYVTITDLAKKLGLSHTTISRALNDHPRISTKTKIRVKEMAESQGYQANSTANKLSQGRSETIAVIIPDLSVPFFSKVLESIQSTTREANYSLLFFNTSEQFQLEIDAVQACLKHRVDGVLAAISIQTKSFTHFEKLLKHEIPLVFFDRVSNFLPVPKVTANDHQAAFNATQYLINSGCKTIAHITGSINLNNSNNRLYGYLDALTANDIEVDEDLIHYYEFEPQTIDTFLTNLILQNPNLDGLFVFNDYVANYAVNVLQRLGKKIPEDISVFGFSDEPVATYMTPQLSTVEQVATKMGQLAAQKILAIINKQEPTTNEKIIINPQLVIRQTTK